MVAESKPNRDNLCDVRVKLVEFSWTKRGNIWEKF